MEPHMRCSFGIREGLLNPGKNILWLSWIKCLWFDIIASRVYLGYTVLALLILGWDILKSKIWVIWNSEFCFDNGFIDGWKISTFELVSLSNSEFRLFKIGTVFLSPIWECAGRVAHLYTVCLSYLGFVARWEVSLFSWARIWGVKGGKNQVASL